MLIAFSIKGYERAFFKYSYTFGLFESGSAFSVTLFFTLSSIHIVNSNTSTYTHVVV